MTWPRDFGGQVARVPSSAVTGHRSVCGRFYLSENMENATEEVRLHRVGESAKISLLPPLSDTKFQ